jgi:hypothetical protein
MTLSIKALNVTVTLSITDTYHNNALHYPECRYAERRISYCYAECHYAEFRCADCRGAILVM